MATTNQKPTESQLSEKQSELQKVKEELKSEKFKGAAADAGTKAANLIGSVFGTSKIERLQNEIEELKADNTDLLKRLGNREAEINRLHRDHQNETDKLSQAHKVEVATKQAEINCIIRWFPDISQLTQTTESCRRWRFLTKTLHTLILLPGLDATFEQWSSEAKDNYFLLKNVTFLNLRVYIVNVR